MLLSETLTNNLVNNGNEVDYFINELKKLLRLDYNLEASIRVDATPETTKISVGLYGTEVPIALIAPDFDDETDYTLSIYEHKQIDGMWCNNRSDKVEYLSTCTPKRFYTQYVLPAVKILKEIMYSREYPKA